MGWSASRILALLILVSVAFAQPLGVAPTDSRSKTSFGTESVTGFADADANLVDDELESSTGSQVRAAGNSVEVIVWLNAPVTEADIKAFELLGGEVTNVYSHAINGFSGTLPFTSIPEYSSSQAGKFKLIEKSRVSHIHLDTATRQNGVRTAVWNPYGSLGGFRGSEDSSIVVIDTGMDDSHTDLSSFINASASGWEAVTDSTKIVGWVNKVVGSNEANEVPADINSSPYDGTGHGSHCSGIVAGRGAASGNTTDRVNETYYYFTPSGDLSCRVQFYNVTDAPGLINLYANFSDNGTGAPGGTVGLAVGDGSPSPIVTNETVCPTVSPVNFCNVSLSYTATENTTYSVWVCNMEDAPLYDYTVSFSYPAVQVGDGYDRFSGVAPDSKLVGARVCNNVGQCYDDDILAALEWILDNYSDYHIKVASMSVGGSPDLIEDAAITALVDNGIVVSVSAGNDYPTGSGLGSPARAGKVISVCAIDDNGNLTYYSSDASAGQAKPDVCAPGGSYFTFDLVNANTTGMILSVDSNDWDYDEYTNLLDIKNNDYIGMSGTSMAAPNVAGLAALVVQAIEFNNNTGWGYTGGEALEVKNILLLTASETGRLREHIEDTGGDPAFDGGGRDVNEGFGRVNGDAAIEAVMQNLPVNLSNGSDYLGGAAFEKRAWARRVYMNESVEYQFNLTSPDGADFDLYLYNVTGDENGSPILLSRSINGLGEMDQINFTPAYTGVHYLAVKRFSGNGTFNLVTGGVGDSPLTVNKASQSTIDMWGGIAAWADKRSGQWDVYGYNLSSGTEFPISTAIRFQGDPAVYEDVVVWVDRRNGNWDVYGKNLTNGTEFGVFVLPGAQDTPDVYGDIAVAYGVRNGVYNILAYNASDASVFNITSDTNLQLFPAIYGSLVVFEDNSSGVMNIKGYNLSNGANFTVSPSANIQKRPDVYRDVVAWFEDRSGSFDIFAYNLTSDTEIRITDDASVDHRWPRMYGTTVVWHDNRSGVYGIYGYVLPSGPEFTVSTSATAQVYPVPGQFGYVWQGNPFGDNDMLARGR